MEELIPAKRQEVADFRKEHGNTKIGEVTVGMVNMIDSPGVVNCKNKKHCNEILDRSVFRH